MEHTRRFDGNLHRICEDLRKTEDRLGGRLVKRSPRKLVGQEMQGTGNSEAMVAEEPAEYHVQTEDRG